MLLRFRNDQANRRIAPLKVILCVLCAGLFPALLFGQTSRGDGWPTPAVSVEAPQYPSPSVVFSNTTAGFAPEWNRMSAEVVPTDVPTKPSSPGRGLWIASIVALAGANVADARSSWNKDDANRALVGAQGKFGTRGVLIKSGVNSLWVVGQLVALRKNPGHRRLLAIVNFAAASVFTVVAFHNNGIASPGR